MKIKNILILCLSLILVFMLTSCKGFNITDYHVDTEGAHEELEQPEVDVENFEELEIDEDNFNDSYLGEWQTEDGSFTYTLKEDGQLITTSAMGTDENCHWEINDNIITFTFSDMGAISYNILEDKLECTDDPEWYLIRK